jgi:hypothetical protein
VIAGVIESFISPTDLPAWAKFTFAALMAALLAPTATPERSLSRSGLSPLEQLRDVVEHHPDEQERG